MVARAVTKKITDLPLYSLNLNQGNILYSEGGLSYQYPMSGIVKKAFTFTVGGTLQSNTDRISDGVYLYYWTGQYPKIVAAGTTIQNTGGIGVGAWAPDTELTLRDYLSSTSGSSAVGLSLGGTVNDAIGWVIPENFGVDYSNAAAGLQAAMNYAVSVGKPLKVLGKTITLKSQITIPTQLVADFTGSVFIADAAITSGAAIVVDGSGSIVAGQYAGNITGLVLIRPLSSGHPDTSSNVDGISFTGSSGQASDMKWVFPQVYGFRDNIRYDGPNTYLNNFISPRIGFAWRRGIAVYASVNSNENHFITGGSIFNCNNTQFNGVGIYIDPTASDTELHLCGTSIDYCDLSIYAYLGRVECTTCHFENNNNNPHVTLSYTPAKEKPTFVMHGGVLGGGPGITTWTGIPVEGNNGRPSLIYAVNTGSVNVHLYGVKCGGYKAGVRRDTEILKVEANNTSVLNTVDIHPILDAGNADTSSRPLRVCNALNAMYVTSYSMAGWTQSVSRNDGTITFSVDTTVYYDSNSPHSRKYVGTAAFSTGIYQDIPCVGGKIFNLNLFVLVTALTAGSVNIRCEFYAPGNTLIATEIKTINAVTADWTQLWVYRKVPNGAVSVRVQEYYNGFTGTAYFSNENLWFH